MVTDDDARGEIADNGLGFVLFVFEICWAYEIFPDRREGVHEFRSRKGTAASMESLILLKLEISC